MMVLRKYIFFQEKIKACRDGIFDLPAFYFFFNSLSILPAFRVLGAHREYSVKNIQAVFQCVIHLKCHRADGIPGSCSASSCAKNDDGLIEVCYCKTTTLFGFLGLLPVYTAGKHLDDPKTSGHFIYRQAKTVDIHSDKEIELCLDGEMLAGNDFHVEILPQAISFIIPA